MGCGESKHAVDTANTISQGKRSHSTKRKGPESAVDKATDDVKTDTNASVQSPENGIPSGEMKKDSDVVKGNDNNGNKAPEGENGKESAKAKEDKEGNVPEGENVRDNGDANGASEVEKVKEIEENVQAKDGKIADENKEMKEENTKESKQDATLVQGEESHRFFSPRKDGESIESVISEGLSGKSEYQTPRAREGVSEGLTTENETTDAKGSPGETKIETKTEEEAVNVNDVKEAEAVSPAEGKDSAITKEEKASTADEEIVAEGSTKDSKTN